MHKTKIEYVDFTVNPITGKCPHGCSYCYAERMRKRFKWPEKMEFKIEVLRKIRRRKKPTSIFMGSMFDLFSDKIIESWIDNILYICKLCPQHTFLFLTKNPKRYLEFKFPDNC